MASESYWAKFGQRATSRRRILFSGAGVTTGLAFLAACGGGSKSSGGTSGKQASGLVLPFTDESKSAKRGGTYKINLNGDFSGADIWRNQILFSYISKVTVSGLLNIKPGYLKASSGEIGGDLAESWEFSPDGLQLTMKLRQNVFWHPVAPVNGRRFDIDDVNFTWRRWSEIGQNRGQILNSVSPTAPVESMTTPDSRTMVFKLKFPTVGLLGLLVPFIPSYLLFAPREAESQYDFRNTVIGTGPFYISNYTPSVGMTLKRHPNHWDIGVPYFDEISMPFLAEYAARLAQFRTGNIYATNNGGFQIRPEDILQTKRDVSALDLYALPSLAAKGDHAYFGRRPASAFRDERVRQAFSMSWDRDAFIDVVYNVGKFQSEGLPVETRWNSSSLSCNFYEGWWLDPKSKEFGPNAQYFKHDIAEAKKLLNAAGYASGLEQQSTYSAEGYPDALQESQIIEGMAADAGFRFKDNNLPFATDFLPRYRDSRGDFEGVAFRATGAPTVDAIEQLITEYSEAGPVFFTINEGKPDAQLESFLTRGRSEIDVEKRRAIVFDIQRYLAKTMYALKMPGGASSFTLQWPVVRNRFAYNGDLRNSDFYYAWLDESKAPINKGG